MCKKLLFLASFVLVLGLVLTSTAKADLIGWYRFEEGSGDTAFDSSDYGNDGTLGGDPQWVDGYFGGGLELSSDYVVIDGIADDLTENNFAVSAWINTTMTGDGNVIGANNDSGGRVIPGHDTRALSLGCTIAQVQQMGANQGGHAQKRPEPQLGALHNERERRGSNPHVTS